MGKKERGLEREIHKFSKICKVCMRRTKLLTRNQEYKQGE